MRLGDNGLLVDDVGLVLRGTLRGRLVGVVGSGLLPATFVCRFLLLADAASSLATAGVSSDRGFLVAFLFTMGHSTVAWSPGFVWPPAMVEGGEGGRGRVLGEMEGKWAGLSAMGGPGEDKGARPSCPCAVCSAAIAA